MTSFLIQTPQPTNWEHTALFSERNLYGDQPARRVLRFGQRITGADIPAAPDRVRGVADGPLGRLRAARLQACNQVAWLRLSANELSRELRTIPLNASQGPAPTPDTLELRGSMRVRCHEGYIGKLAGLVIDPTQGLVTDLIVKIRGDAMADVSLSSDPMFKLGPSQGAQALISPAWAISTSRSESALPFMSGRLTLILNASVEQVASAAQLRSDGQITADIWRLLDENPAIAPYLSRLRVQVRNGDVTLLGTLPTPRHRASAEQDIWHATGVLAFHNEVTVTDE
ncbi:MAG TPA: BON domain-containing protein [Ktedonobacterales bacterium]|nr:BON domain-containing protein [Ktedonobacterales bacterium]